MNSNERKLNLTAITTAVASIENLISDLSYGGSIPENTAGIAAQCEIIKYSTEDLVAEIRRGDRT